MIDKVVIAAGDAARSAGFYGAVLGVVFEPFCAADGVWIGHLGGLEVWIVSRAVVGVAARDNTVQVRFVVADVAAAFAAAEANGGVRLGDIEDLGAIKLGAVRDPDGYIVELIHR